MIKNHRLDSSLLLASALILLPALTSSLAAQSSETSASEREREPGEQSSSGAAAPSVAKGALIFVDPATGQFVDSPSPSQRQELRLIIAASRTEPDLHESALGLTPFAVPGGIGVNLQGRFTSSLLVRLTPEASSIAICTDDHPDLALVHPGSGLPVADR